MLVPRSDERPIPSMATSVGARPSFRYVIEKPDSGLVTTMSRSPTNCTPRVTTRLTRLCCRRCPFLMTRLSDNLLFDLGLVQFGGAQLRSLRLPSQQSGDCDSDPSRNTARLGRPPLRALNPRSVLSATTFKARSNIEVQELARSVKAAR